ncbi:Zinc finger protein 716 [Amphibalanus amphitrite]|uniref:Zinc finger protein 716 n=1 Tax=Amphibalanus amphitrite TaxID=1232801 RepID=A0A6A4W0L6_AMPAM|nr:Zinc finger protein 716 [Amphibalanus amphitrite]
MESWLTEALGAPAGGDLAALLPDPGQLQLDFSVPLELLYDEVTAFRCRLCSELFGSLVAITEHIEQRHCQPEAAPAVPAPPPPPAAPLDRPQLGDKQLFLCSECGHVSDTLRDCKLHLKRAHLSRKRREAAAATGSAGAATKPAEPPAADETQPKKTRERRPPPKLRHDKRFQCRVEKCSLRFTCEQYRATHERCHVTAKSFKCSQCTEFTTTSWTRVMTHMWRAHGTDLDLFKCDKCRFRCALYSNMENHRQLHVSERRFVCTECNKGFRQLSQLLNHRVVHAEGAGRLSVPKWFRPHVCPTCSKMFSSVKTLRIHQRILHEKVRSFCCRVCNHTSATKALLQLHMRGHSGETPFVCTEPGCDYKTRDPSTFRRHKMRHTGVRPYSCPHCDYECIQSSAIKSHIINRHGGLGIFRCQLCNFCTVNEISYGMHMSDHQKGLMAAASEEEDDPAAAAEPMLSGYTAPAAAAPGAEPPAVRHEYVFTIAPDSPAEDRGGISIPAGQEEQHLVTGIIGGDIR